MTVRRRLRSQNGCGASRMHLNFHHGLPAERVLT